MFPGSLCRVDFNSAITVPNGLGGFFVEDKLL
jgi:hypothetical protein